VHLRLHDSHDEQAESNVEPSGQAGNEQSDRWALERVDPFRNLMPQDIRYCKHRSALRGFPTAGGRVGMIARRSNPALLPRCGVPTSPSDEPRDECQLTAYLLRQMIAALAGQTEHSAMAIRGALA